MTMRSLTILAVAVALSSCATRQAVWDTETIAPVRTGMSTVSDAGPRRARMLAEGEQYWAQRADENALRNAIARFDQVEGVELADHVAIPLGELPGDFTQE